MPQVSVPHCYLPNSKVQVFDVATSRATAFQIARVKEISEMPDFAYFVTLRDKGTSWILPDDEEVTKGPYSLMWYTRNGQAHCETIGQKRKWNTRSFAPSSPAPLDSVVYSCRCN
jgi:hypothetical protein